MDKPRRSVGTRRHIRRGIYMLLALGLVVGMGFGLNHLKPVAPTVESATVWTDIVKKGEMLRQVRGVGTLVPEEIRWIPAVSSGRIERILVKPGAVVQEETILMELSNPELEREMLDAEWQLRSAEAEYQNLLVQTETEDLSHAATAATVQAEYSQAKLQAETNQELAKQGLISELTLRISQVRAQELATRHAIEQKRLGINKDAIKAQLASQRARVEQQRALYDFKRQQLESLRVRAGMSGVLQQVPVEVGQQVSPGLNLARVANPSRLKAELRIPETQAKDVQLGQKTLIDTRNGIVNARVFRIDPAVQNGTVTVDVALEGELPKGARPDLSVDGIIEIERLENVIFMGRPMFGQEHSTVGIFKLSPDGKSAVRVQVRMGRSSVNTIEVVDGLKPGDRVILSDTSAWDSYDRINLN